MARLGLVLGLLLLIGLGPSCDQTRLEASAAPSTGATSAQQVAVEPQAEPPSTLSASAGEGAAQDAPPAAVAADPDEVGAAATASLPGFLDAAWGERGDFGFGDGDRREDVALGRPWPVWAIDAEVVAAWHAGRPLAQAVVSAGEWIFPVEVGGAARTLFGVRHGPEGWRGAYLGNPQMAEALAGLRAAWDGEDEPLLVSCTAPRAFFFLLGTPGGETLTPLTYVPAAGLAPPADWRQLDAAEATVAAIEPLWDAAGLR